MKAVDLDVVAVEGKGLYLVGDEDPWKILSHEMLMNGDHELAKKYQDAIDT